MRIIMAHFMLTCCFFIQMILMNEKVIGEDVERYAGKIHLKETGGFVPAVSYKTLVTPADTLRNNDEDEVENQESKR
jgi:hypothetical protein